MEISEKLCDKTSPILEHQEKIQRIADSIATPKFDFSSPAIDALKDISESSSVRLLQENTDLINQAVKISNTTQEFTGAESTLEAIQNSPVVHALGELAMKSAVPTYQFESPVLKKFEEGYKAAASFIAGLNAFINNPVMKEIQIVTSSIGRWLQTVDFSPLINILENFQEFGFKYDYEEVNEIFLKAMFDARWFPYAGLVADFEIVGDLFEILGTSQASKNRIKRIDKLIFNYYSKDEINNFKRNWREMNLPSYMTRILVQAVQAYHRREYALTVSALSTLWEGIIQEKVNDESYRVSRKTRENLSKLIEENEFSKIFSSFCNEFIFYDCRKPEEIKPDVPGRHGIAHCWYNTYPNRKMALNAVLFTDFLLRLKPLDKVEETDN